jgi:hypothetical protein
MASLYMICCAGTSAAASLPLWQNAASHGVPSLEFWEVRNDYHDDTTDEYGILEIESG